MRKVCAAILSAAICLAVSGAPAWASEHQSTLSAGYLHASTNVPGSDDLNGINVKYRYEFKTWKWNQIDHVTPRDKVQKHHG
ncbi:outer membrane protein Lom encoded by prophage CP-933R [Escherichia coli]|nr:outer membrane protein Lom encoded by prophage CP-933R [Escherichia coli]